jgi:type II secretory pathway pseudopilin PulG
MPPSRGFAYIALLVLIAILTGASAAALSAGSTIQRRAAEEELLFVGSQFRQAFRSYYESAVSVPRYPPNLEALLKDPRATVGKRHLRKVYADPLTGKAEWGLIQAPGGGIMGVYSVAEGVPIKQAGFTKDLSSFENRTSYREWEFAWVAGRTVAPTAAPVPTGGPRQNEPSAPPTTVR